jgi:hypothetical protein
MVALLTAPEAAAVLAARRHPILDRLPGYFLQHAPLKVDCCA